MSSDRDDPQVRRTADAAPVGSAVEDRGGYPVHEPRTEGEGDHGLLRIGRHDREQGLNEISRDAFAEEFEERDLVSVYHDDPNDGTVGEQRKRSA